MPYLKLWRNSILVAVVAAVAAGGCIKREPRVQEPQPQQAAAVEASPPEGDPASRPATGNYGKVVGVDVLGGQGIRAFRLQGETDRVKATYAAVQGQPFKEAVRAEVREQSQNVWDVQIQAKNTTLIEQGDVLLATFSFRTEAIAEESGEGKTEFVFELARDPWPKSVTYGTQAAGEWKKVYVPFVAAQTYKPGEAQANFRLGYSRQTVQFGGVSLENFGKTLALADLPKTQITYPGMEAGAEWRAAAKERIEKLRKAELTVAVQDAQGKPVPGAKVKALLTRHAFGFGTCAPAAYLVEPGNDQYKKLLRELFNTVTLENDLKWVPLAGEWGSSFTIERANKAIDWLHSAGISVRGHVLVWPGWENLPKSLRRFEKEPEKLRAEVDKHIREVAGAVKGKVAHWDVVNEPFTNHDLLDILGYDVMVDWFKLARSVDPAAKLFINDYAILSGGGGWTAHREHYRKMIKLLVDKGAPVDGIGVQGHFGTSLTGPADLLKILDRYADFKKPIHATEYDIVIDDEELAGRYTRDFYTALFSHPAVQGVVMWGFWDGSHWKDNAPMYRRDFSLKPGGKAYRDLVLGEWRTNASGQTDDAGAFTTRGFLGEYSIEVNAAGATKKVKATLEKDGTRIVVKL